MPTQSFLDPTTFTISVTTAPAGALALPARRGIALGDFSPGGNSVLASVAPLNLSGAASMTIGVDVAFETGAQPDTLLAWGPLSVNVNSSNLLAVTNGNQATTGVGVSFAGYSVTLAQAASGWHRLLFEVPFDVPLTPANTVIMIDGRAFSLSQIGPVSAIAAASNVMELSSSNSGAGHWDGYLANLFIWDGPLTDTEAADWFAGFYPTAGLVAGWPMNDGTGTSCANVISGGPAMSWFVPSGVQSSPFTWL